MKMNSHDVLTLLLTFGFLLSGSFGFLPGESPDRSNSGTAVAQDDGSNLENAPAETEQATDAEAENGSPDQRIFPPLDGLVSTVIYAVLGLIIFAVSFRLMEFMTPFSISKELIEDENIALGVLMAGMIIGLSLIIAFAMS